MNTCSHCHHHNRAAAFFCKQCGHPIVCPRCRLVLERPLNFCDNCGQLLAVESDFQVVSTSRPEGQSLSVAESETQPVTGEIRVLSDDLPPVSQGTLLEQFVPNELMAKLEAARTSGTMVGERRVVTILFCDVKGSTEAAEKLDPEEWTEIINGAFEHMIKPVYSYEGTVARLMGDGILAFFGAPITHEDDPQRAILAGLDIVSAIESYREQVLLEWGIEFDVRVGINTGRVVVGAVGSDLRMEYTAMGDAINMASRMEQTAVPGTIQVAHDTYKIVSPLFEFEDLGGIEVKGKSDPVPAYRVIRRKAAPGRIRGIEGLEIELIGRDLEMANLRSAVEDVRRGVGSIVCVLGEAGLGKSRLIRELQSSGVEGGSNGESGNLRSTESKKVRPNTQWFDTTSLSYETAQPYALFRRLIRRINGINHNDSPAELREKLSSLAEYFPPEQVGSSISALEALFGLQSESGDPPLEGEAFKRALFRMMPSLWRQRFADKPTIIVYDDLHWSDSASIDLLHDLLPLTEEMAIIFLFVFRPNREAPGWRIKKTADETYHHRYTEIDLRPLSVSQSNQMIDALLGRPELPEDLRSRILEQAAGNPFFIEEVIRTLIDGGALLPADGSNGHPRWRVSKQSADIHIPDNLQALLTARIDNLSEDVRQTLQVASVIGRNFYQRVLRLIHEASEEMDSHLQTLLQQNMIRESARIPEIEYRFRNPLTQEAAYRTILLKHRRQFHLRVGEVMETIFTEQLEEQAPQLAHHFREAHQFDRALHYFRKSGDLAFRLFANAEASTHYGDAIEMARQSSESVSSETLIHIYSRRGRALEHQIDHQGALDNYESMLALAGDLQDQNLSLKAMMAMATVYSLQIPQQDIEKSQALSEEALVLAQSLGDRSAEATINWNLMNTVAFSGGDPEQGLAYGEASLQIAREMNLREQIAYTLNTMMLIYWNNNQIAKGRALLEEVRALWLELDNQPMLADSYSMAGFSYMMSGDYRTAVESYIELEHISKEINNTWNLNSSQVFLGLCYLETGEIGRGIYYLEEAIKLAEQSNLGSNSVMATTMLALGYSVMGAFERANSLADEAFERRDEIFPLNRPLLLGLVSAIYIRCGAISKVQDVLAEMADFDRSDGNVWLASYAIGAEAEFALAKDKPGEAIVILERHILRLYEVGSHSPLPYFLYMQGLGYLAKNDLESAVPLLEKALRESERTGERYWRWQILVALIGMATGEDPELSTMSSQWQVMAAETINYIAESTTDLNLRKTFLERSEISALNEISSNL